jgi:DNA repair exonuclease SbcCD ATPase subunit
MIIINSNQDKLDSQSAEISSLKRELEQLKSKLCPTCGQTMPQEAKAIYRQPSTTGGFIPL